MAANIGLKAVDELLGLSFFIPRYQRGYRWGKTQVINLLNDIEEFIVKGKKGIYCVQPLVVQKVTIPDSGEVWEVIDGQQRLTTISILLQVLGVSRPYCIDYAVLEKKDHKGVGSEVVNSIMRLSSSDADNDVNLFHMAQCRANVEDWLSHRTNCEDIRKTLLTRVKFIWYENDEEEPIKIFTRLNIGKIALTNSELIKALFLNRDNFLKEVTSEQLAIAQQWDVIESSLQNDEFWLFINNDYEDYSKPTRIDFLFDYICDFHRLTGYEEAPKVTALEDEYRTFNYFYDIYQKSDKHSGEFLKIWDEVRNLYGIFNEWFSNIKLYHYVGYVITCGKVSLDDLVNKWENSDKATFINSYLFDIIKRKCLSSCANLERQYTVNNKTEAKPLLLLHNVQKIVNQNRVMQDNMQYKMAVYYKFPFHLLKKEKWDVEHIDSSTENEKMSFKDKANWILSTYPCLSEEQKNNEQLQGLLLSFFEPNESDSELQNSFSEIMETMLKMVGWNDDGKDEKWKNRVRNYTLLDRSTNRSYHNAIFPVKRLHIIGKEKGELPKLKWDAELKQVVPDEPECKNSAFVPIVTKEVFQKTYSIQLGNLSRWDEPDAKAYEEDIRRVLSYVPLDVFDENGRLLTYSFLN